MVSIAVGRLYYNQNGGSYAINFTKGLIEDSACPIKKNDELDIEIKGDSIIITKREEK